MPEDERPMGKLPAACNTRVCHGQASGGKDKIELDAMTISTIDTFKCRCFITKTAQLWCISGDCTAGSRGDLQLGRLGSLNCKHNLMAGSDGWKL